MNNCHQFQYCFLRPVAELSHLSWKSSLIYRTSIKVDANSLNVDRDLKSCQVVASDKSNLLRKVDFLLKSGFQVIEFFILLGVGYLVIIDVNFVYKWARQLFSSHHKTMSGWHNLSQDFKKLLESVYVRKSNHSCFYQRLTLNTRKSDICRCDFNINMNINIILVWNHKYKSKYRVDMEFVSGTKFCSRNVITWKVRKYSWHWQD